jgi:predicted DCC family thiol-disulfide oxidoreductase YuxK
MAWVEPTSDGKGERVFIRSEAVVRLGQYLGFPWRAVALARLVPRGLRDQLYDWVAKRRRRWFLNAPTCAIGTGEHQDRMLGP